jgi:hypothetical protein
MAARGAFVASLAGVILALGLFAASLAFLAPGPRVLSAAAVFGVGWLTGPLLHVKPLPADVATAVLQVAALSLNCIGIVAGLALSRSRAGSAPAAHGALLIGCLGLVACVLSPLALIAALGPWSHHAAAQRTSVVSISLAVLASCAYALLRLWRADRCVGDRPTRASI